MNSGGWKTIFPLGAKGLIVQELGLLVLGRVTGKHVLPMKLNPFKAAVEFDVSKFC